MLDKLIDNPSSTSESQLYEMTRNELFEKHKTRNEALDTLILQKMSRHEATKMVDDVIFDYATELVTKRNMPANQVKNILEQKLVDQHVILAIIKAIYSQMASVLVKKQKITSAKLTTFLIEKGLTKSEAADIASNFSKKESNIFTPAATNIALGSLWLIGGLAVTFISYYSSGEKYILAYGAIIGGVVQLMIGLGQKNKTNID